MVNKVLLIGNLGKDPELRFTGGGKAVANFSLATSEKWRDDSGNLQEKTEWHQITVWGKSAENCAQYLKKGSKVFIEGQIRYRSYEKDGVTRYATDIHAQRVQFLSTPNGASGGQSRDSGPYPPQSDDDIPF